ncbi:MAG: hypothetical protein KC983_12280, partial [Phycisphaerales bacterium]|nr:hypothetical protein [Phycisphaerales bacterium]
MHDDRSTSRSAQDDTDACCIGMQRRFRWLAIAYNGTFGLAIVMILIQGLTKYKIDPTFDLTNTRFALGMIGVLVLVTVYFHLYCARYCLRFGRDVITQTCALTTKSMRVDDIVDVHWRIDKNTGRIDLRDATGRTLKIDRNNFEQPDLYQVVAFIHQHISPEHHREWSAFHARYLDWTFSRQRAVRRRNRANRRGYRRCAWLCIAIAETMAMVASTGQFAHLLTGSLYIPSVVLVVFGLFLLYASRRIIRIPPTYDRWQA